MPFTKIAAAGIATTGLVTLERLDVTNNVNTTGIITASGGIKASLLGTTSLVSISSTITATATDVFVYDTRKDSDGGAWRKRTQHTSWYNETLNTATRGSRRDFPAVAVIVTTSSKVTIYDGDDPDLPMWMVFNGTANWNQGLYYSSSVTGCVFALNGIIGWGDGANAFGIVTVNFISELSVARTNSTSYGGFSNVPLVNRNSTTAATFNVNVASHTAGSIVGNAVNDVAMTVLPNAPIDPSTGLPVPTIAVATAGGISVIKDDGTVANVSGSAAKSTSFIYKDNVVYNYSSFGTRINPIPASTTTDSTWGNNRRYGTNTSLDKLFLLNSNSNGSVSSTDTFYHASSSGLTILAENTTDSTTDGGNGMVAYATTSYNTGWMHGDIKGAFLSGISTASVTGTELVTNGDFASGTTGWTANGSGSHTFSVVSGTLQIVRGSSGLGAGEPYQNITLTAGKTYILSWQVTSGDMTTALYDGTIGGTALVAVNSGVTGYFFRQFTVTTTGTKQLLFISNNANSTTAVDNVSIREAELDRSINNKGLAVYGTITKTAVATGADLVYYGGFNLSNYLQQVNVNINFANPWYMMGWFPTGNGTVSLEKFSTSAYNNTVAAIFASNGYQSSRSKFSDLVDTATYEKFFALVYSNGVLSHYAGGSLVRTISGTYTTETADLLIGIRSYNNAYDAVTSNQGVSLLRIGQAAPSADQIKKIYNDEKALFQQNSKATLYGTSSAVTALAYDDTTRLLSVGTSSGRSDFQGLERINNTTTAVTTAISASNGLVAEQ